MHKPRIICYSQRIPFLLEMSNLLRKEFRLNFDILIRQETETFLSEISNKESEIPLILIDKIENVTLLEDFLEEITKRNPKSVKILWINPNNGKFFKALSAKTPIYRCIIKPYEAIDVILSVRNAIQKFYHDKQIEEKNNQLEESLIQIKAIQDKLMWAEVDRQELLSQLEDVNNSLEDKVKLRTQELQTTLNHLQSTQKKLIESEKMASLGLLSASIAHEIKNPIGFISGSSISLRANFDDMLEIIVAYENCENFTTFQEFKEGLENINDLKKELDFEEIKNEIEDIFQGLEMGGRRSMEIINSLNTFSRRDSKTPQKISLHTNIDGALLILKGKHQQNIKITKNYATNVSEIICFPSMLNQVFVNIIANSIDAISMTKTQKGSISIATDIVNNKIKISIQDDGIGMSKEVQNKIFETFFTTKQEQEVKGTGLGLSITSSIIKKHKGNIQVKSEEGKGSTFVIMIPRILKISQIVN